MTDAPVTKQTQLKSYLFTAEDQFRALLPENVTPERFIRITLMACVQNPDILECTRESVLLSAMEIARLGLEPGGALGQAYLVPFKNVCQMILGYKGMITLASRAGKVTAIEARAVMHGDEFEVAYGTSPLLCHVPKPGPVDRPVIGAYAIARLGDVSQFEFVDVPTIDAARRRSRARGGPWATDYPAMATKTAVRRLAKFLPLGDDTQHAIAEDTAREFEPEATYMDREEVARNWREVLAEQAARIREREGVVNAAVEDSGAIVAEVSK